MLHFFESFPKDHTCSFAAIKQNDSFKLISDEELWTVRHDPYFQPTFFSQKGKSRTNNCSDIMPYCSKAQGTVTCLTLSQAKQELELGLHIFSFRMCTSERKSGNPTRPTWRVKPARFRTAPTLSPLQLPSSTISTNFTSKYPYL